MPASLLMLGASMLFSVMGVCVKYASADYSAGEIVLYRSVLGLLLMLMVMCWRRINWRTPVPGLHLGRCAVGTTALCLWFYSIAGLPLATAMTLNYMSSVWIALFLLGGAVLLGPARSVPDIRLVLAVLAGFVGVALILRPTLAQDQLWHGLMGLLSGVLSATAYLQVTALGRAGEPGERVVLYFSAAGIVFGAALTILLGGPHGHSPRGLGLLLTIGLTATVAQWMMTRAYAVGATLGVAALQYTAIVFGFGFGVWLFDDPVTTMALAGMALIIGAGVYASFLQSNLVRADGGPTPS